MWASVVEHASIKCQHYHQEESMLTVTSQKAVKKKLCTTTESGLHWFSRCHCTSLPSFRCYYTYGAATGVWQVYLQCCSCSGLSDCLHHNFWSMHPFSHQSPEKFRESMLGSVLGWPVLASCSGVILGLACFTCQFWKSRGLLCLWHIPRGCVFLTNF